PVLRLDAPNLARRIPDGFGPRHLTPSVVNRRADHRLRDPIAVRRVAPREPALHARVALVRAAVLVRHHANDLIALHLGAERTADAAVGARRLHGVIGLAELRQRLLDERRRRTRLHAGAARDAL